MKKFILLLVFIASCGDTYKECQPIEGIYLIERYDISGFLISDNFEFLQIQKRGDYYYLLYGEDILNEFIIDMISKDGCFYYELFNNSKTIEISFCEECFEGKQVIYYNNYSEIELIKGYLYNG